jgi:hypothetical protein
VTNLIRFINEFWFINFKNENLEEKIKSDTNLANSTTALINKVKIYDSLEVKYLIILI